MTRSPDPTPALVAVAAEALHAGGTVDHAAEALMRETDRPILAIKALRVADPSLTLAEAKHAIDRHLSPEALRSREELLDQLERLINEDPEG